MEILKHNKAAAVISAGAVVSLALISQLYWAHQHQYRDIYLRLALALAIGLGAAVAYIAMIIFVVGRFFRVQAEKIMHNILGLHLCLYLLWLYAYPFREQYLSFITNLTLAALLAFILGIIYRYCASGLSNRQSFAGNFMLITITTLLVIQTVKSSLALSLGLVGALSIVRFRTAIKDPEELAYLFINIAIGLGLGANQIKITLIVFVVLCGVAISKHLARRGQVWGGTYLALSSTRPQQLALKEVIAIVQQYCSAVHLKRCDSDSSLWEASFLVEFKDITQLDQFRQRLQQLDSDIKISLLDSVNLALP